jgi:hypothetical protein
MVASSIESLRRKQIENCDDDASGKFSIWLTDAYVVSYYGDAPAFKDKDEAERYADQLYKELMDDCGVCEYGICYIDYPRPVKSMTQKEARKIINGYFDDVFQ